MPKTTLKPVEILVSCPDCGQKNFTQRGLKAHVCKARKSTSLAVVETKPIDLDKLDGLQKSNSWTFDSDELGRRAKSMFEYVESLKTERSKKAILVGVYLHQVRAALPHGEFDSWKTKHFAKSRSTIGNYMALAAKFSRSAKLLLPEVVAANQLSLDLKAKGSTGEAFMAKLDKFVGNSGLTELMQKHAVIQRGGYRPSPQPSAPPPETTNDAGDEPFDKAEATAFQKCSDAVEAARKALTNELYWTALTVESAELIEAQLKSLQATFHDLILKAKHARQN